MMRVLRELPRRGRGAVRSRGRAARSSPPGSPSSPPRAGVCRCPVASRQAISDALEPTVTLARSLPHHVAELISEAKTLLRNRCHHRWGSMRPRR